MLREVLEGTRDAHPAAARRGLVSVAVGEWAVLADGVEIVFFITNGSLDYVAKMRFADQREAGFTDWIACDESNPLDLLADDERQALEHRLHAYE